MPTKARCPLPGRHGDVLPQLFVLAGHPADQPLAAAFACAAFCALGPSWGDCAASGRLQRQGELVLIKSGKWEVLEEEGAEEVLLLVPRSLGGTRGS